MLKLKRIYVAPATSDGYRILVDRLWPRGLSKERAHVDVWMKEIAPSNALRKWFGHDPKRWTAFRQRYWKELRGQPQIVTQLKQVLKEPLTIVYGGDPNFLASTMSVPKLTRSAIASSRT